MMIDLPPPDPGLELVVASRGISKGIAQTDEVQVLARAHVRIGTAQAGAQWKNITSPVAGGEAALFVNGTRKLSGFNFSVTAAYKFYTEVERNTDSEALELTGGVSREFGPLQARLSLVYSPDDLGGTGRSVHVEVGPTITLTSALKASANVARRTRTGGEDYTAFNVGVSQSLFDHVSVDLRYYDTAQGYFGEPYHRRFVFSARLGL